MTIIDKPMVFPPGYQPRSSYFKWVFARARLRPAMEELASTEGTVVAFCPGCDTAFLQHEGRRWSPCCGLDPTKSYNLEALLDLVNALAETVLHDPKLLVADGQEGQADADPTADGKAEGHPTSPPRRRKAPPGSNTAPGPEGESAAAEPETGSGGQLSDGSQPAAAVASQE